MGLSNAGGVDTGLGVWSRDEYFNVLELAPIIIINRVGGVSEPHPS